MRLSLAVESTAGSDLLPMGVNALGARVDLRNPVARRRIRHLRYLGGTNNDLLCEHSGRYFAG